MVGPDVECEAVMRYCGAVRADIVDILRCQNELLGNGVSPCEKLTHAIYADITTRKLCKGIARGRMRLWQETVGVLQMGRAFLRRTR
jgi:hypothetical protein